MLTACVTELEPGYFEMRVNWTSTDLMAMNGEQFDRLKHLIHLAEHFPSITPTPGAGSAPTPNQETPNP